MALVNSLGQRTEVDSTGQIHGANYRIESMVWVITILLWCIPLTRAFGLYRKSQRYFAETGSIDAGRDMDFSLALLLSYTWSLGAALGVVWCLFSRPRAVFALPVCVVLFAAYEVIRIRPEEPIVFFPSMHPYRPAIISILALLVALALRYFPRRGVVEEAADPE